MKFRKLGSRGRDSGFCGVMQDSYELYELGGGNRCLSLLLRCGFEVGVRSCSMGYGLVCYFLRSVIGL
jgi:hypothetical protein